jgi:hypothetical protein
MSCTNTISVLSSPLSPPSLPRGGDSPIGRNARTPRRPAHAGISFLLLLLQRLGAAFAEVGECYEAYGLCAQQVFGGPALRGEAWVRGGGAWG